MPAENTFVFGLTQGYVHDWLIAGPLTGSSEPIGRAPSPPHSRPLYLAPIGQDAGSPVWQYQRGSEDHLLHAGPGEPGAETWVLWAYTELHLERDVAAPVVVSANGQIALWHNERPCDLAGWQSTGEAAYPAQLRSRSVNLGLQAGSNRILIGLTSPPRATVCRLALGVPALAADGTDANQNAEVRLPTTVANTRRFQEYADLFEHAYLRHRQFVHDDIVALHWPETLPFDAPVNLRLQSPDGRIYSETAGKAQPGGTTGVLAAATLLPGRYQLVLMPPVKEFVDERMRVRRALNVEVFNTRPATTPQKGYVERLADSLRLLIRQSNGLPSELATVALGAWSHMNTQALRTALAIAQTWTPEGLRDIVGLVALLGKYGNHPSFPGDLRSEVARGLQGLHFPAGTTNGNSANAASINGSQAGMYGTPGAPARQSHVLLYHTAQILAGQFAPTHPIGPGGRTGSQLRHEGEVALLARLRECGHYGFQFGADETQVDDLIFALGQLVTLAKNDVLADLAAVVLDKLYFSLALTTHQGLDMDGLGGAAAKASYIMWGAGCDNAHPWGLVGLADSTYQRPEFLAGLALAPQDDEWSRQVHRAPDGSWTVDWTTYRTPDYVLSARQTASSDPGGEMDQKWAAVMGDRARVYTNHPLHCGPDYNGEPGFWQGNGSLPRVAQWQNVLFAGYRLPQDVWLDFTHAHFPIADFDEHWIVDNWAFARKGQAYLALTASADFALSTSGVGAYRELGSSGRNGIWLCQMGRTAVDGSFSEFQEHVRATQLLWSPDGADYTDPHGNRLQFAWDAPLVCNGEACSQPGELHYQTPYAVVNSPATRMEIHAGDAVVELDFS